MRAYQVTGYFSYTKELYAGDEEQAQEIFDEMLTSITSTDELEFDNITTEEVEE